MRRCPRRGPPHPPENLPDRWAFVGVVATAIDRRPDALRCSSTIPECVRNERWGPPRGEDAQTLTFPGSSFGRGILTKHLFNDKLCRIEFYGQSLAETTKRKKKASTYFPTVSSVLIERKLVAYPRVDLAERHFSTGVAVDRIRNEHRVGEGRFAVLVAFDVDLSDRRVRIDRFRRLAHRRRANRRRFLRRRLDFERRLRFSVGGGAGHRSFVKPVHCRQAAV